MTPEEIITVAIKCGAIKHEVATGNYKEGILSFEFSIGELTTYTAVVEAKERERCAKELDLSVSDVLLMAGEMTRLELSAVMAVIKGIGSNVRSLK